MSANDGSSKNGGDGENRGKLLCYKLMVNWAKKQELISSAKVSQLHFTIPAASLSSTDCQSHGEETSPAKQCLIDIFRSLYGDQAESNDVANELLKLLRCICNEFSNSNSMLARIIRSIINAEPGFILSSYGEREQRRRLLEYIAGELYIIRNCVAAVIKNIDGADRVGVSDSIAEIHKVARLSGEHWPANFDQTSRSFIESALYEMSNVVVPINNMFGILRTAGASSFVVSQIRGMLDLLSGTHFNGCLTKLEEMGAAPIFVDYL